MKKVLQFLAAQAPDLPHRPYFAEFCVCRFPPHIPGFWPAKYVELAEGSVFLGSPSASD